MPELEVKGDQFLGLKNGSLIESIYFRNAWLKDHLGDDAIILVTSPGGKDGHYPPVTAVTVYTSGGRVWAHSTDYGPVTLDTLKPDDLLRNASHCLDEYLKTVAKLPLKPVPVIGGSNEQVQHAFDAVHDPEIMPYFPVALADVPGKVKKPDGAFEKTTFKCLVFDWNDAHYVWRPSMGAHREDPPIEPLTGRPLLCVKHSDLVESLIFVHDYQKAHPEEKAALLYAPPDIDTYYLSEGLPAAIYSVNGHVYIRGYFSAAFEAKNQKHPYTPADLDNPQTLADLNSDYRNFLMDSILKKYFLIDHPFDSAPIGTSGAYSRIPSVFPQSLPGDNAEIQENRILQRATDAGITCEINPHSSMGRIVMLYDHSQRFFYAGNYEQTGEAGGFNYGPWDPNIRERLIDAILFAHNFKPGQPGDKVIVLPYREPGLLDIIKAISVYVRGGNVYAHSPIIGEVAIPSASPSKLDDPQEYHALGLTATKVVHSAEQAQNTNDKHDLMKRLDQELQVWVKANDNPDLPLMRNHVYYMFFRPGDMSRVDVPPVYETLKVAGIDCQLYPTTAERGQDGKITEYALPSLGFTFQGVRYTYGPEHYCSAASNLILDP
ncbi:MAG TPA: hypothetical protein VNW23_00075 [Opitutaceae bacterium]|nr:hypothetical protein [Opitutaceae bacterium]